MASNRQKCPVSVAAQVANLWPGMTAATAIQFSKLGNGGKITKPNSFVQKHERYYHQVAYAAAGQTQLNFFNVGASEHVCNLNQGLVPDERPFWLTGVCVTFQDLTAAGAEDGATHHATSLASIALRASEIRKVLMSGLLQMRVADRLILDVQDLTHFPSDGAFNVASVAGPTAALVSYSNGLAVAGNRFRLPAPYPILPGKPVSIALKWAAVQSITTNGGRVKVELVGESVLPLNG